MTTRGSSLYCATLALCLSSLGCNQRPSAAPAPAAPLVVDLRGSQIAIAGRPVADDPQALQRALFTFYQGAPTLELRGHVGDDEQTFRDVLREAAHGPSPLVRIQMTELQLDLQSRLRAGVPRGVVIIGYTNGEGIEVHVRDKSLGRLQPGDPASESSMADAVLAACGAASCSATLSLASTTPLVGTLSAWKRVIGKLKTTLTISSHPPTEASSNQNDRGRLSPSVIQHTVRDYFGTLRRCYESGLGRDSHLMGDIILSFVIGPDGSVTQVENDGGNMPDEYVVTCVLRRLEKLRFPKPEGGVVKVVYPIAFTSEP